MKKELYDQLSYKEKMMYDELYAFSKRLSDQMDEVVELLKTIIAVADQDP